MKLGKALISQIQSGVHPISKDIANLTSNKSVLISKKNGLEKELSKCTEKFGWQEKYFSGYLGGDRTRVKKVANARRKIENIELGLTNIEHKFQKKSEELRNEISAYLNKNDAEYAIIIDRKNMHFNFYKASAAYFHLVKKAHQGVIDALLFVSWEKLIRVCL